ncbi:metal-sulfur cluster assembly factor [uncultured Fructobacillus sp.]|jgi:metal-sulfur cluster biosynthetic enzyme|uniref:metal-sulfur cluster assembly factor n=1 Tax=uncultured Fructobacillus sp. TaxID=591942 RepID=UPI0025955F27|nr:iron-sulfur cluster assembly protein [uncultured Fructobacillus sp.]
MRTATENLKNRMVQVQALSEVIDPELKCDIINLGLVYGLSMDDHHCVTVRLTLTTMGCPLTEVLETMIERAIMNLVEVEKVVVELVWSPAWNKNMMSDYAKLVLGVY